MLDLKRLRENTAKLKELIKAKGGHSGDIDKIIDLDDKRKALITGVQAYQKELKKKSKEVGALMGQKKVEEATALKAENKKLGDLIAEKKRRPKKNR